MLTYYIYIPGILIALYVLSFTYFGKCWIQYYIDLEFLNPKKTGAKWYKLFKVYFYIVFRLFGSWFLILILLDEYRECINVKRIRKYSSTKKAIKEYFTIPPGAFEDYNDDFISFN